MNQYLFTYLNQKNVLKSLKIEAASKIISRIQEYRSKDNVIAVFGRILRNGEFRVRNLYDSYHILHIIFKKLANKVEIYYYSLTSHSKNQAEQAQTTRVAEKKSARSNLN